jgi:GTPase SAR1 family protein
VLSHWQPQIEFHAKGVPYILVGTKTDLRADPETLEHLTEQNLVPKTQVDGAKLARTIGAYKYVECSASTQTSVREVFVSAVRCALAPQRGDGRGAKCIIL